MLIERPVLDASWLHPHRSTMKTQGARAGYVPIIGARNGLPWSKSELRPDGRFGYAGYGLVPRWGLQVRTEPNDFTSIYKTPKRRTYRGYSGLADAGYGMDSPTYWGGVGVGVGVFASTLAVSLLVHGVMHKGVTPGWKGTMPAVLPSLGAGMLAFLLYQARDKACGKGPQIVAGPEVAGETVAIMDVGRMRPNVVAKQQCPEGTTFNPETGNCEYGLI
jgi:hypothetical protein